MSKHALTVVVAVIIAVSLLLYMFAFQVRTSQVAVLMTFGKPSTEQLKAGYHFKMPWPIQDVRKFDNRIHVEPSSDKKRRTVEVRTQDNHNILVSLCVGWEITDAQKFNANFGSAERPEEVAWARLEGIIRDHAFKTFGTHSLAALVSTDTKQLQYDQIEEDARTRADTEARNTYGLGVRLLKLRRLELPETATKSVYERMKKEREQQAQKIKSEGDRLAAEIKGNAEAKKSEILSQAKAEAERIRGEGDAKAASYYKEFAPDPALAIYLREIRALSVIAKNHTTLILDPNTPPFNLLLKGPPEPKMSAPAATEKSTPTVQ